VSALAAERIKLFSTRSPWVCTALAIALVVGMSGLIATVGPDGDGPISFAATGTFLPLGMVIVMVMATLAVTTEYRFSTIRTTFQAVPNRTAALLAKTTVVAVVAAVAGLVAAFGAWAAAWVLQPDADLALATADRWRTVAGAGLVFAVAAVLAVAVGILIRQTAGAVSLLLVWVLLAEHLVGLIPDVGQDISRWLPFMNANQFLTGEMPGMPFGPWGSLAYFAALAAGVLAVALVAADRRDA
jgi:ABC-2 type transport system permease protein